MLRCHQMSVLVGGLGQGSWGLMFDVWGMWEGDPMFAISGDRAWRGPMSDDQGDWALYSEVQCIMGNSHIWTPFVNGQAVRHD